MKKNKKGLKICGIIIGVIIIAVCINMLANTIYNNNKIDYVSSFEPVKFEK